MPTCPSCNQHDWTDDVLGMRTCAQCRTAIYLSSGAPPRVMKPRPRIVQPISRGDRNQVIVAGQVICACCGRGFSLADTIEGRIEPDPSGPRTRMIKVQVGYRLIGGTLFPAFDQRPIPSTARGRICIECANAYGARHVGKPVQEPPREHIESLLADLDGNGYPKERDPDDDGHWAHSMDPSWLSARSYSVDYRDDLVSDIELIDRMIQRGPLWPTVEPAPWRRPVFGLNKAPQTVTRHLIDWTPSGAGVGIVITPALRDLVNLIASSVFGSNAICR